MTILLNPDSTSAEIEAITEQCLRHDEDIAGCHAGPSIISMSEHVSECINAGLTSSTGIATELESTDESDISIPIPIITGSTEYSCYISARSYNYILPSITFGFLTSSCTRAFS